MTTHLLEARFPSHGNYHLLLAARGVSLCLNTASPSRASEACRRHDEDPGALLVVLFPTPFPDAAVESDSSLRSQ